MCFAFHHDDRHHHSRQQNLLESFVKILCDLSVVIVTAPLVIHSAGIPAKFKTLLPVIASCWQSIYERVTDY